MSIRDKLIGGPLGFGAAPLGNIFRDIPEGEAAATVEAAWERDFWRELREQRLVATDAPLPIDR